MSVAAQRVVSARSDELPVIGGELWSESKDIESFYGAHQGGIGTPMQAHTHLAAFDLTTAKRDDVRRLLQRWTDAAANLCTGLSVGGPKCGAVARMKPSRLTITFGFGPGLFIKNGEDRFGLGPQCPSALVELPAFAGDQLEPGRSNGDLSIQACADDARTAFHAVCQLARLAYDVATLRWAQSGSTPPAARQASGFGNRSSHPSPDETAEMDAAVWVANDGPVWMHGGSYVVIRRIRNAPASWERMALSLQVQPVGRAKSADVSTDSAARVLTRSYLYNHGPCCSSEHWPPSRQAVAYESGLLLIAYQKDPRSGFIRMFERLVKFEMMRQLAIHTGSGVFACPPGVAPGQSIGAGLFV